MEITADIETLIANPFALQIGKMIMATGNAESEKNLDYSLKFLNYGRVAFPEILIGKLSKSIKQVINGRTSYEQLDEILTKIVLDNLSKTLRQCYISAFPINSEERKKYDLPNHFDHDQEEIILDQMSFRSRIISDVLLGLRQAYLAFPRVNDTEKFSIELDESLVLNFTRTNGNFSQAGMIDSRGVELPDFNNDNEKDIMQSELKVVERWIELLNDLLFYDVLGT